jgi:hypothetical protein
MRALDYEVEPLVECLDSDVNDAAFVQAMAMIGARDAVEEFLACGLYPLSPSFGFRDVMNGTTVVSKVVVHLPVFPMEPVSAESVPHFLVKIETDAE